MYYSKLYHICQYRQKKFILIAFLAPLLFFLMYGLASAQSTVLNPEIEKAVLESLRATFNVIHQAVEKEISLFEKEALSRAPQKEDKDDIKKIFNDTRKELVAIFEAEFLESCKRGTCRIVTIEPNIKTIKDQIGAIHKEEFIAGCVRAECSAEEIQKIARAYIIKKYIAIPKFQEYSVFVQDAYKLLNEQDVKIVDIIHNTEQEIKTAFLGIGNLLRLKIKELLIQASGQLRSGISSLHEVDTELINITTRIKENTISVPDIIDALARIKKDMEIFQRHRRVDGTIDPGIGENILQILGDEKLKEGIKIKNKELAKQGKPKIILQEYIISVQQLIGQTDHYIKSIDGYVQSDEMKRLYEVLPTRVVIDKPLVFPPRKPLKSSESPSSNDPFRKPRRGKLPRAKEGQYQFEQKKPIQSQQSDMPSFPERSAEPPVRLTPIQ